MNAKPQKGTYGYLDKNKWYAWKKAALFLSVPILIFIISWIIHKTRMNVMTVAAIVGCLPGCNQVVRAILASRYSSIDQAFWEQTEAAKGRLPVVYENVFTSYEKNYYVDVIAVCGKEALGYSSDPKLNPAAVKYDEITIDQVIEQKLAVVDLTACILCMENHMPMYVFGLNEENSIVKALSGDFCGTKVTVS